jgi:hypothetical protein
MQWKNNVTALVQRGSRDDPNYEHEKDDRRAVLVDSDETRCPISEFHDVPGRSGPLTHFQHFHFSCQCIVVSYIVHSPRFKRGGADPSVDDFFLPPRLAHDISSRTVFFSFCVHCRGET